MFIIIIILVYYFLWSVGKTKVKRRCPYNFIRVSVRLSICKSFSFGKDEMINPIYFLSCGLETKKIKNFDLEILCLGYYKTISYSYYVYVSLFDKLICWR